MNFCYIRTCKKSINAFFNGHEILRWLRYIYFLLIIAATDVRDIYFINLGWKAKQSLKKGVIYL